MPLNVTLGFPGSPDASAAVANGLKVQRYDLHEAMSELFELTIEVLSTDPAIGMARDPGKYAPLLAWLTDAARGNLADLGQIIE